MRPTYGYELHVTQEEVQAGCRLTTCGGGSIMATMERIVDVIEGGVAGMVAILAEDIVAIVAWVIVVIMACIGAAMVALWP